MADKYVSFTGTDAGEAAGGGSGSPYRTIDYALRYATDGDNILLEAGDWDAIDDFGAGTSGRIDVDGWGGDAKSMTLKPLSGTVNIIPPRASACIQIGVEWPDDTLTFQDVNIKASAASLSLLGYTASKHMKVVFDNCLFTDNGENITIVNADTADASDLRDLRFINGCELISGATYPFLCSAFNTLIIDDSTFTTTDNTGNAIYYKTGVFTDLVVKNSTLNVGGSFFLPSASMSEMKNLSITDNEVTMNTTNTQESLVSLRNAYYRIGSCIVQKNKITIPTGKGGTQPWPIKLGNATTVGDATVNTSGTTVRGVKILDNEITCEDAYKGVAIQINGDSIDTTIVGNKIVGFAVGIENREDSTFVDGNIIDCGDPCNNRGSKSSVFTNNTLVPNDYDAVSSRGLMFARRDLVNQDVATAFAATTVTGGAWDLAYMETARALDMIASGRVLCLVKSGTSCYTHYGIVSGVVDATDIVTVDEWIKVSDGSIETPSGTPEVGIVIFSEDFTNYNNIIDASNASYNTTYDFNPMDTRGYQDYNCYVVGTNSGGSMSNLGYINPVAPLDTFQASLAEVQACWAVESWTQTYAGNDACSLEVDPQLDSDYKPQNPQVLRGGKPDINGDSTSMGAIGASGSQIRGYRGRYR